MCSFANNCKRTKNETSFNLQREQLNAATGHTTRHIRIPLKNQTHAITCIQCLSVFTSIGPLKASKCQGHKLRRRHLAQKARWWKFAREHHSSHLDSAVLAWKLTQDECRYVEESVIKVGLSQTKPGLPISPNKASSQIPARAFEVSHEIATVASVPGLLPDTIWI